MLVLYCAYLRTHVHICCVQAALEAAEQRGVEGTDLTYIVAPSMENQLGVCEGLRRALSDRQRQEASELGVLGPDATLEEYEAALFGDPVGVYALVLCVDLL